MTSSIRVVDETEIGLRDQSDIAVAVSAARSITRKMGFSESRQFLIASAVSELATNIVRYAETGWLTIKVLRNGDRSGFEVIARDEGPGIPDLGKAMEEHYSGGTGLGLGLPSVRRIMDEFDIQSRVEAGTTVIARKWRK